MHKFGIKARLIILVLVATVPLFIFNLHYITFTSANNFRKSVEGFIIHHSRMVSDDIDDAIIRNRRTLITLSEIPDIKRQNWNKCTEIFAVLKPYYLYYENIFVADTNGLIQCSAILQAKKVSIADRAYFSEALKKREIVVSEAIIGRITGKPVIVLAYPVKDYSNNLVGVIGVSLSLLKIYENFAHTELPKSSVILVVDEKGRIITSNIESDEYNLKDIKSAAWFPKAAEKKGCCFEAEFIGKKRLIAVTSPSMVNWLSVIAIPYEDVYGPFQKAIWDTALINTLVLSIALFAAIILGRLITGPITQLARNVKEISSGGFKRLMKIKTKDEIEDLADSFNEMVVKLDERKVENEKLQKQLFLSQKMEAIGTLTGGIAHDFNNMLNVILGYTQLVIDETKKNTTQHRYIQQIQKAGQSAAELVQQLLAFSRRQIIDPRIININEAIYNLVKMLHRIIGENIALKLSLSENVLPVMADPGQMVQVIMNLCVNARDAMPQGGELTIESSNTIIDKAYCQIHPWALPGSYALLSITDTGIGMDSETQTRIFEPFFTTKEQGKGTGLGLAIVYGIIKQHKGLINVYSQKGHGTTFKIYLPSASGKTEALEAPRIAEIKGGNETILLAEDNDMLRELAETILKDLGYTVIAAKNGDEAIQIFTANSDKIQLTVLDVIMPVCSGREAYDRMRAVKPDLKVIFVTGYSIATHHTESIAKEKLPLLQKPFSKESLARKVREALDS